VVLCLSVRLNRKTRSLVGAAAGNPEMFWLESMEVDSQEEPSLSMGENEASSQEEVRTTEVRWYRLRGRTYFSS